MALSATDLYQRLGSSSAPAILDVRNAAEFARWRVEGRRPADVINVPYFEFIEAEDDSVAKVEKWLGPKVREVAVVCAKGGSSDYVAEILRARGLRAENVEGGMIAWGLGTVFTPIPAPAPLRAWQGLRFGRGCLSYVLASGSAALVVDPHRDGAAYRSFLSEHELVPVGVIDTHLHADHVSGASAIADSAGIPYFANAGDFTGAKFAYTPISDGQRIALGGAGGVPVVFMHAPGHTPGSTVILANDALLLTGDTLCIGSVGRPDLGGNAAAWARDLHRTLHAGLAGIPDEVLVLPGHAGGPGEMLADGTIAARLGALRRQNPDMTLDEQDFIRRVGGAIRPAPAEYARIRAINHGGVELPEDELVELELGKNECAHAPGE